MQIVADVGRMEINGGKMEVEHKGEVVVFIFSTFKKDNFANNNEVFKHINTYWAGLPEATQQKIFNIYKEIEDCFDDILNKDTLTDRLKNYVKELYDLHPFETLKLWASNYSGLIVPVAFKEHYEADIDRNTTEDKTYVRAEYRDLLTLSLMFRLMVPIWATYVRHIRSHTGNGLKELQAFRLLERTEIPDSPPVMKLLQYIQANIKKENATIPVSFISEDDFPYWVMTLTCVRRLCVGDLQSRDPRANLVTLIHNFINQKTNYNDGDFSNTVQTKTTDDFGGDENKISTMECFRINTEISVGESEELQFSMEDIYQVAEKVCIGLPKNLLDECLQTSTVINQFAIFPPQKSLMAWVLKDAITPEGIDFLDKDTQVRCLGLTQAVLWNKGFKYLALLSTSVAPPETVHRVAHLTTKARVPEELQKKLREVYPHVRVVQHRKTPSREECFVTNDIEQITNDLANFSWRGTASPWMIQEVFNTEVNTRITIIPEIRIELTKLAIAVGQNLLSQ